MPATDEKGNIKYELEEVVVSFFEATIRANNGEPIIDKTHNQDKGWQFLFTMKQNEYFVFPRYETTKDVNGNEVTIKTFDPKDIDLLNPDNYSLISPNLFRVQKLSSKNYVFRHHLETTVDDKYNGVKNEALSIHMRKMIRIVSMGALIANNPHKVHVSVTGKISEI